MIDASESQPKAFGFFGLIGTLWLLAQEWWLFRKTIQAIILYRLIFFCQRLCGSSELPGLPMVDHLWTSHKWDPLHRSGVQLVGWSRRETTGRHQGQKEGISFEQAVQQWHRLRGKKESRTHIMRLLFCSLIHSLAHLWPQVVAD